MRSPLNTPESHTLIGMPTAGKTKIGGIVARELGWEFVDLDDRICEHARVDTLQELVDQTSSEEFGLIEGAVAIMTVRSLVSPTIIATGGSIIYSPQAMERLYRTSHIIYLRATLETVTRRVARKPNRGIVFKPGETLADLYARRVPEYERWAHMTVDTDNDRHLVAERLSKDIAEGRVRAA